MVAIDVVVVEFCFDFDIRGGASASEVLYGESIM